MVTGPTMDGAHPVPVTPHPEHDSCPRCGGAEIGTAFSRSDTAGPGVWECHCSDCRFRWSVNP